MSIVINTPNGNIGRKLALALLDAGESITVISRSTDKAAELAQRGARVVLGSLEDEATLRAAFEGGEALFWLNPPNLAPGFFEKSEADAARAARLAKAAGIERVVVLSSVGAHSGPGVGPVSALRPVEAAFEAQLPHVVALRAGFFMENYLRDLGTIASMGKIFSPANGDMAMPLVATADIADRAAALLRDRTWQGHRALGVHGPRDLGFREAAGILARVLERPVEYVQVSLDQARAGMVQAGLPEYAAEQYVEMYAAMNAGRMNPAEPRDAASTTPTELAEFARTVLRPALAQFAAAQ
jgi:uncharacterized protein YbjT (DUF2867 family)